MCGAFVLWLAAVCAGSQDLRAAAQAVRDSSLAQRLVQWELGDLWAADSLPLPVLTVPVSYTHLTLPTILLV